MITGKLHKQLGPHIPRESNMKWTSQKQRVWPPHALKFTWAMMQLSPQSQHHWLLIAWRHNLQPAIMEKTTLWVGNTSGDPTPAQSRPAFKGNRLLPSQRTTYLFTATQVFLNKYKAGIAVQELWPMHSKKPLPSTTEQAYASPFTSRYTWILQITYSSQWKMKMAITPLSRTSAAEASR